MTNLWKSLALGTVVTSMAACSGGGGGGDGSTTPATTPITISGKFNGLSLMSMKPMFGVDIVPMAVEYSVYCQPKVYGVNTSYGSKVGADGMFSIVAQFPPGAPVGCILEQDGNFLAVFSFNRTASTTSGTSHVQSYPMKPDTSSLNLGDLTISGSKVEVDPAKIVDNGKAEPVNVITDLTGAWRIASVHEDQAQGFVHPCDMDDLEGAALAKCKSDVWKGVYLNMYKFKKGDPVTNTRFGVSLWQSGSVFETGCAKSEGFAGLSGGWSVDEAFNANGPAVKNSFPMASIDLSDLNATALAKAPFNYYSGTNDYGFYHNCPIYDSQGPATEANVPALCKGGTVTTCAGFDGHWGDGLDIGLSADEKNRAISDRKVRCVMNTLTSGGETGYKWADACGRRMDNSVWDSMHESDGNNFGWGRDRNMSSTGNGCNSADCSQAAEGVEGDIGYKPALAGISGYWNATPRDRLLQGEVSISGSVGSGSAVEERVENIDSHKCAVEASFTYTFTKTGANTMTLMVENVMTRDMTKWAQTVGGVTYGNDAQCLGTAETPTWMGKDIGRTIKIKMNLVK